MNKTLVFISTHIINNAVISEYKKMLKVKDIDLILAIDNTTLKIPFDNRIAEQEFYGVKVKCFFFDETVHKELKLPCFAEKNPVTKFSEIMWYNSDYRFYYVRKYFPDYDYYWQFEYDIYCNGDSYQPFFDKYSGQKEDLLTLKFKEETLNGEWHWSKKAEWMYKNKKIYGSLYPIVRLSSNATDFLYKQRLIHADIYEQIENKEQNAWIFCELFQPTELMNNNFTVFNLYEPQIRYMPEYDLNDCRLFEQPDNLLYHPIKGMFVQRAQKLTDEVKLLKTENTDLSNQNEQLKNDINILIKKNKKLKKKVKKLSVFKINLFGIKISHKRKV